MGVRQLILTSRLDGPADRARFGRRGQVMPTRVDMRLGRQAWAPLAAPLALSHSPVDVVHGHCGEDIAVLPLARLAARRHRCPLVITVHSSVRHNMRVTSARTAWLRLAGAPAERRALAAADMVIALTQAAADRLAREGLPDNRIRVIPPGYDPDLFAVAAPDPSLAENLIRAAHAACWYSCSTPPSRSRRRQGWRIGQELPAVRAVTGAGGRWRRPGAGGVRCRSAQTPAGRGGGGTGSRSACGPAARADRSAPTVP